MTSKPTIMLFYAIKKRDAFNCILLKYVLEQQYGCRVILHRVDNEKVMFQVIRAHRPAVVILLDVKSQAQVKVVESARQFGYRCLLMPSEMQLNSRAGQNFYLKNRERFSQLEKYLAPGEAVQTFLVQHGFLPEKDCPVVGYPRYDAYGEPFVRYLTLSREEFLKKHELDGHLPIVLWASNNRYHAITESQDPQALRQAMIERYEQNHFDEDMGKRIDTFLANHTHSLEVVSELLQRFGDRFQLFYRPRQGEVLEPYHERFRTFPQARIVYEEDLTNLLTHADLVFHGFSLLGSEAWIFGKPTVSYCFQGLDQYYFEAFKGCEEIVTDREGTRQVIERLLEGEDLGQGYRERQQTFLRQWYHTIDGRSTLRAARIIRSVIDDAQGTSEGSAPPREPNLSLGGLTRKLKQALGIEEFRSLNPLKDWKNPRLEPVITTQDIQRWSRLFDQIFKEHDLGQMVAQLDQGQEVEAWETPSPIGR